MRPGVVARSLRLPTNTGSQPQPDTRPFSHRMPIADGALQVSTRGDRRDCIVPPHVNRGVSRSVTERGDGRSTPGGGKLSLAQLTGTRYSVA